MSEELKLPADHIKAAERMAEVAADINVRDSETAHVYATLAVAHAQIAVAQMMGRQRA